MTSQYVHPKIAGLTLVELVVTLSIVAVLALGVAPSMAALIENRRIDRAVSALTGAVSNARLQSIQTHSSVRLSWHHDAKGACYLVHTGAPSDCHCQASGEAACSHAGAQLISAGVVAQDDALSLSANVPSMLFNPLYGTSTPTATWTIATAQGRAVHHVVNVLGRGRSCSPQGQVPGYPPC